MKGALFMPSRARTQWKPATDGQYTRQIGWKISRNGKVVQAKFRLGKNKKEAQRRDEIIREIWDHLEQSSSGTPARWSEPTLAAAKQAAASGRALIGALRDEGENERRYAHRVQDLQDALPKVVAVIPDDTQGFESGVRVSLDILRMQELATAAMPHAIELDPKTGQLWQPADQRFADPKTIATGPRLHDAMRKCDSPRLTDTGRG